jgi:DNA-binding transcriptional regulator YbjK
MIMLGVLAVSVALSAAGFWWADGQLQKKSAVVSDLLAERDAQSDKIDKLKTSKNSIQDAKKLNDLIYALLPKQKQQENLVVDIIYTATKQAGIDSAQITNINFNSTGVPDSLSGTSVSKEIQGVYVYPFTIQLKDVSFNTLIQFFSELEKNKRIIQADQVQITPDKTRAGYLSGVSLSLKTFVQP